MAPILAGAKTWADVHRQLGEHGIRYERKGSGAEVWLGDQPMKASKVGRAFSLAAMEKRLGAYESAGNDARQAGQDRADLDAGEQIEADQGDDQERGQRTRRGGREREREIRLGRDDIGAPGGGWQYRPLPLERRELAPHAGQDWKTYQQAREWFKMRKEEAWNGLRERQADERLALLGQLRRDRVDLSRVNWRGLERNRAVLASGLAAIEACRRADLRDRHLGERAALRGQYGSFPSYEAWLARDRSPEAAQAWRERFQTPAAHGQYVTPEPRDIRAMRAEEHLKDGRVDYHREREDRGVEFADRGDQVTVHQRNDRDTTLAALQLSAAKWGGEFRIEGSEAFKRQCVELAVDHGFKIQNLTTQIAAERRLREMQRKQIDPKEYFRQLGELPQALRQKPEAAHGHYVPPAPARDIQDMEPRRDRNTGFLEYHRISRDRGVEFSDRGDRLPVTQWQDRDTTLAALQVAAEKWPQGFTIEGQDEFKQQCARLAVEHGFKIQNLDREIEVERQLAKASGAGAGRAGTEKDSQKDSLVARVRAEVEKAAAERKSNVDALIAGYAEHHFPGDKASQAAFAAKVRAKLAEQERAKDKGQEKGQDAAKGRGKGKDKDNDHSL